jgi:hypothetical protein
MGGQGVAGVLTIKKPKYARGEESVMTTAEKAKIVNTTEFSNSENRHQPRSRLCPSKATEERLLSTANNVFAVAELCCVHQSTLAARNRS